MAGYEDTSRPLLGPMSSGDNQTYGSFGSASTQCGSSSISPSSSSPIIPPKRQQRHRRYDYSDDDDDDNGEDYWLANDRSSIADIDLEMNTSAEKRHSLLTTTGWRQPPSAATITTSTSAATQILTTLIPGISWLRSYSASSVIPDLMGALTVASLYIPLAFSFASVANVPPASSLYAFVFHPPVYALLGTCPLMVTGPEATGSLLVGAAIHALGGSSGGEEEDPATNALIAGAATALAGLILLAMGFLRLGFLDNMLSRPLMKGFICGVGVVLVVKQAVPGLGLQDVLREAMGASDTTPGSGEKGGAASALDILLTLLGSVTQVDLLAAVFSVGTLGFVLVCAHIKKAHVKTLPSIVYIPDRFIAIVVSAVVVYLFDLESHGLEIVGAAGSSRPGLPTFNAGLVTDFDRLKSVGNTALMIAMLGYFESSVTGKSMGRPATATTAVPPLPTSDNSDGSPAPRHHQVITSNKNKTRATTTHRRHLGSSTAGHSSHAQARGPHQTRPQAQPLPPSSPPSADRELVALGAANVLGGFFSTLPAFGGFGRSKLNLQAGSQTPMSGVFLALITFLAILFVTPLLYFVPRATLAAMSCAVGIAMVEECAHDAVFFVRARAWREVALMGSVAGVIFVRGMDVGVVVGLGVAVVMLVKGASGVSADVVVPEAWVTTSSSSGSHHKVGFHMDHQVVLNVRGTLSFVNAAALVARIDEAAGGAGASGPAILVLDMLGVTRADACCGQLLVEALQRHAGGGLAVVVVCSPEAENVLRTMKRCGLLEIGQGVRLASDHDEAMEMVSEMVLRGRPQSLLA
ncbi:sulfate transporter family-domain-containing protein [Microdochium trichocladiopsis]|uniref:Sulfate transporter family-domain-containing protein n=1 Tax=Microdochium trichocladiopsis TaxID=1682393 RepID=A0A9P9BPH5_9PEZI|nr:sulfate transporter family-domain-containing protein [Microdochium trichocladiopsis]KAH7024551.1 sulfate transporter family-domain-containing protein [Microdochium trichocladiopsis]